MDYGNIIKRAWSVTWRYRILWVFGLLAGGASSGGGGGGGNSGYTSNSQEFDPAQVERFFDKLLDFMPLIIGGLVILTLIGLMFWIVSVAARGGLVFLVNEAEENRPVRGRDGWSVGFAKWGRVFLLDLILGLPLLLVAGVFVAVAIVPLVTAGSGWSDSEAMAGLFGLCGTIAVGGIVLFVLAFIIGLLSQLALRYAVLDDLSATGAIGAAWQALRSRFKDLIVMWLLLFAIGIGYGLAVGVVAVVFAIGIAAAAVNEAWGVVGAIAFVLFLVLLLPNAIYSAFLSSAWTVFFRRLTGRDPGARALDPSQAYAAAPPVAPYPPAPPASAYPPPAPAAPEQPAEGYTALSPETPGVVPPAPPAPPAAPEAPQAYPAEPPAAPPAPGDDLLPPPPGT